ncbi:MAG: hypothetical protein WB810_03780 [Candidatus Cybelea sp.]
MPGEVPYWPLEVGHPDCVTPLRAAIEAPEDAIRAAQSEAYKAQSARVWHPPYPDLCYGY